MLCLEDQTPNHCFGECLISWIPLAEVVPQAILGSYLIKACIWRSKLNFKCKKKLEPFRFTNMTLKEAMTTVHLFIMF